MFRRKNEISFIASDSAIGLPTPYQAYKVFPEWFVKSNPKISKCPFVSLMKLRQLEGNFKPNPSENQFGLAKISTVKHCPGIVDYLKTGYILPAWCDMVFRMINGSMIFDSALNVPGTNYGIHGKNQFCGMTPDQHPEMSKFHKITSPWYIKTSPGVSILITDPYWDRNKNFTSVSAVVHPDLNPIHLRWFFEFNQKIKDSPEIYDESLQVIKKDTPLALIIPFKRENFSQSLEYLDTKQMQKFEQKVEYSDASWFSERVYDKLRRSFNIWYK